MLALDVGDKRIGVARMHTEARLPEPLEVIDAGSEPFLAVLELISRHNPVGVVIGLPRGLDGQETSQTQKCRDFAQKLAEKTEVPIYLIDEAGTSKAAEERQASYPNAASDSVAATFLLEDFASFKDSESLRVERANSE